jgi:DNA (cytosine-5)-methyltransferase 1
MKFFDLFAGIGGFRLGMERVGHECVGSCEIDKHARETYKKNFGEYPEYDDAKDMSLSTLPQFDVLCAGFPCQAFSIAGKRLGFEDPRGNIFFEIARIAKAKRPSYLFLENVKGLLSHEKGDTFRTIISTLDEMGYDAEWQVLNSKYFVPQTRERVFIIGHLRGKRTRQVFPIGDLCKEDISKKEESNKCKSLSIMLAHNSQNGRAINKEYLFTVTTMNEQAIHTDGKYRYLTPVECERVQGFPDNWTIGNDIQRKKQCGNAVTVDVVEYIAKKLNNSIE